MEKYKLKDFKEWWIGDFQPTLLRTKEFEVGVKDFNAGDEPAAHYHQVAIEFTIVLSGDVEVNGEKFTKDDIIEIKPGEVAYFKSISDSRVLTVKVPSVKGDKYLV